VYIHGRLSEHFSGSLAASEQFLASLAVIGKPEQNFMERVTGRFFTKVLNRINQKLYFGFSTQIRQPKIVKTISAHTKSTVLIFRTFTNIIHLVTLSL
jgi:hypothetical protein